MEKDEIKKSIQLIMLFGLVSLFGDIVYEGARSVNGPYLKTLAMNAAMVGFITGLGEFTGYAIRLVSGFYSDKTKAYWFFTFLGYGLIISIPLLSLTGVWQIAALLMVVERVGKGIRAPAKDSIVSSAAKRIGTGRGFGIQEVLDQIGATVGPLIFAGYFALTGGGSKNSLDYRHAYGLFWVPFILVISFMILAYTRVPDPTKLEPQRKPQEPDHITKLFWIYTAFSFITSLGFISYALIGFHFKANNVISDAMIPIFFSVAMATDGATAFIIGNVYDKIKEQSGNSGGGLTTLILIPVLSALIPFFAFTKSSYLAFAAAILWGIVMGSHETIMKAAIADITPIKKRGMGYGIFNFSYGMAMLMGGYLAGLMYDISIPVLCWAVVGVQTIGLGIFFVMKKEIIK